jgi:hypothetical protein
MIQRIYSLIAWPIFRLIGKTTNEDNCILRAHVRHMGHGLCEIRNTVGINNPDRCGAANAECGTVEREGES